MEGRWAREGRGSDGGAGGRARRGNPQVSNDARAQMVSFSRPKAASPARAPPGRPASLAQPGEPERARNGRPAHLTTSSDVVIAPRTVFREQTQDGVRVLLCAASSVGSGDAERPGARARTAGDAGARAAPRGARALARPARHRPRGATGERPAEDRGGRAEDPEPAATGRGPRAGAEGTAAAARLRRGEDRVSATARRGATGLRAAARHRARSSALRSDFSPANARYTGRKGAARSHGRRKKAREAVC